MPLPTGTGDLGAFETSDASHIAAELTAALEPGIQILRPLGAGAMGLVFLGRDPLLKRLVAIKVLSPHLAGDDVARGRFVRESEASAAVSESARALTRGLEQDGATPKEVYGFLSDTVRPSAEWIQTAEPYARTPWLDVWRRFAASPDYPIMWQYRAGLPGTRYLPGLPILPFASIKDLAYRNSIAG